MVRGLRRYRRRLAIELISCAGINKMNNAYKMTREEEVKQMKNNMREYDDERLELVIATVSEKKQKGLRVHASDKRASHVALAERAKRDREICAMLGKMEN